MYYYEIIISCKARDISNLKIKLYIETEHYTLCPEYMLGRYHEVHYAIHFCTFNARQKHLVKPVLMLKM